MHILIILDIKCRILIPYRSELKYNLHQEILSYNFCTRHLYENLNENCLFEAVMDKKKNIENTR